LGQNLFENQKIIKEYGAEIFLESEPVPKNRFIVLLPRKHQFKICDKCVDHWDHAHPLGDLDSIRGRQRADTATAQGIGGARSGRASGGTPAKPGFRRSRKCAQMRFCQNLIYLLIIYK
jgi:hypothetical protein